MRLLLCLTAPLLGVLVARLFFFLADVDGYSMLPTLQDGDRVLALRLWHTGWLRKGQIIVTRYVDTPWNTAWHFPEEQATRYIKRIIGMPGDTVTTRLSDIPEPLQEEYRSQYDAHGRRLWHIPPGYCFVRGDSFGLDSTVIGPIPIRAVQGIMVAKLGTRSRNRRGESHLPRPVKTPSAKTTTPPDAGAPDER